MLEIQNACKTFLPGTVNEHVALDRLDRLTTLMQMLQVVCTLHRGLAVLMDHIACRNSSK